MEENEKSLKSLNQKEENLDTFYLSLDNNIYSINITKNNNNDKIIISAKSGSERNIVNNLYPVLIRKIDLCYEIFEKIK